MWDLVLGSCVFEDRSLVLESADKVSFVMIPGFYCKQLTYREYGTVRWKNETCMIGLVASEEHRAQGGAIEAEQSWIYDTGILPPVWRLIE